MRISYKYKVHYTQPNIVSRLCYIEHRPLLYIYIRDYRAERMKAYTAAWCCGNINIHAYVRHAQRTITQYT